MATLTASPIHFTRRDLRTTSSASTGGLLVYPPTKKSKQRIAAADRTGDVAVFSIGKRLDVVPAFNVAESDKAAARVGGVGGGASSAPVSCTALFADQLFCVRGSVLDAYSRKGKHFFSVDTNATERVHSLSVHTPFFFISGEYMMTSFREAQELGFFMAPDRVHAMVAFPVPAALGRPDRELRDFICCLACNDRVLRLVRENALVEELSCEAPLTALHFEPLQRRLYYGTQAGSIGCFDVAGEQALRRCFSYIPGQQSAVGAGGGGGGGGASAGTAVCVTCLALHDVNKDGEMEVLAGYEDGTVQVFAVLGRGGGGGAVELQSIWRGSVGERVVGVAGGAVTEGPERPDVIVHVYSGAVIAFTLDIEDADDGGAAVEAAEAARRHEEQRAMFAAKKADTAAEITRLQEAIAATSRALADRTGAVAKSTPLVAVASTFTADVSVRPLEHSAMLSVVIDSDVPLDCALIRSAGGGEITFLGTETTHVTAQSGGRRGNRAAAPPSASSSLTTSPIPSPTSGRRGGARRSSLVLATPLRQHDGAGSAGKRLEVLLWADDGDAETLVVTLYATPAPRTAQVKTVPLCALPLYRRVGSIASLFDSAVEMQLTLSRVVVAGAFEIHHAADWLCGLLPGLTETSAAQLLQTAAKERRPIGYCSVFLGTALAVEFHDVGDEGGERQLVVVSDSVTALAAVKRHIVRRSTATGLVLRTTERILFGSVSRRLAHLRPMMERCAQAARQAQLLDGLRELQTSDADLGYMPEGYQQLLRNADAVAAEAALQSQHEAFLKRATVGLYTALVRFRSHAPPLDARLEARLEGVCCGTGYSARGLAEIFFPAAEDEVERASLTAAAAAAAAEQQHEEGDANVLLQRPGTATPVLSSMSEDGEAGGSEV